MGWVDEIEWLDGWDGMHGMGWVGWDGMHGIRWDWVIGWMGWDRIG